MKRLSLFMLVLLVAASCQNQKPVDCSEQTSTIDSLILVLNKCQSKPAESGSESALAAWDIVDEAYRVPVMPIQGSNPPVGVFDYVYMGTIVVPINFKIDTIKLTMSNPDAQNRATQFSLKVEVVDAPGASETNYQFMRIISNKNIQAPGGDPWVLHTGELDQNTTISITVDQGATRHKSDTYELKRAKGPLFIEEFINCQ